MNIEIIAVVAALAFGLFFPWERHPRAKYIFIGLVILGGIGRAMMR